MGIGLDYAELGLEVNGKLTPTGQAVANHNKKMMIIGGVAIGIALAIAAASAIYAHNRKKAEVVVPAYAM